MIKNNKGDEFYFIDLFCGAGGLSKGLEMAGLSCVLGVDNDKSAINTFKKNHPKSSVFAEDISKLTSEKLEQIIGDKEIKLVCGGPPCQGMSTVGKGNPDDPRNFLFKEFVRIVSKINPEYILLENVTGMVSKKNQNISDGIISEFEKLGYHIEPRVLTASHYGVPERRRRTIFLGNRLGYEIKWPIQIFDYNDKPAKTVGEAFANFNNCSKINNHDLKSAEITKDIDLKRIKYIPEGCGIRYQKDELSYLPKELRLDVDWEKIDEGRFRQTKYQRLNRSEPSPTIMTGRYSYYHPIENRFITAREAAAIQSFPNDFIFEGTVSQQWRQIGNAVPPLLAKALGKSILETDKLKEKVKEPATKIMHVRKHAFNYKKQE
ncbi:MAG TPA: DNA cytosine methyltransferase [archaeon]|nr:DNA cytosine methyltransferase [archaeon]